MGVGDGTAHCGDYKSFKDPIYGYIHVPRQFVSAIIDTPAFQRLRRIVQTSYCPLYPSATHNRFVHSLGVFFLGDFAARILEEYSNNTVSLERFGTVSGRKRFLNLFRIACLLHDIGHAPFSHTGEHFYKDSNGSTIPLHEKIATLIGDKEFVTEGKRRLTKAAAPHELMSVIVAIKTYGGSLLKKRVDREFVARAICGYTYINQGPRRLKVSGVDVTFLNCLISLLNSSIVDVDRLDYLIRDSRTIGFNSTTIDYRRLLEGVRICVEGEDCKLAYTKNSLSVLENVVYAHDAERKWVQNHPSILYEMKLLKEVMSDVNTQFKTRKNPSLFCEKALMSTGVTLKHNLKVKYLCDDDVGFLAKNASSDAAAKYMDRRTRLHAVWKSESEFNALFGTAMRNVPGSGYARLKAVFEGLNVLLSDVTPGKINATTLHEFVLDLAQQKARTRKLRSNDDKQDSIEQERKKGVYVAFLKSVKEFAKKSGIDFDFVILDANAFSTGFGKSALPEILIQLNVCEKPVRFGDIASLFKKGSAKLPSHVYYVFSQVPRVGMPVLARRLVEMLFKFVEDHKKDIDKGFNIEENSKGEEKVS